MNDDFEKAFGDFLDRREYDQAENALFSIVRIAFSAGWKAAGGKPPAAQNVIELYHKNKVKELKDIESDLLK